MGRSVIKRQLAVCARASLDASGQEFEEQAMLRAGDQIISGRRVEALRAPSKSLDMRRV